MWRKMAFIIKHLGILFILLPLTLAIGTQLTLREYKRIHSILEKDIVKKYPSDSADKYSDTVTQSTKGRFTYYYTGDEQQPVFISTGKESVGKKVIVIKRGEDYVVPEDKQTFIVLRQKGGGKVYNIHTALIYEIGRDNNIIIWGNARIEQQVDVTAVLNVMGSRYLPRRSRTDKRPRCEWIASVLFCNAIKPVKSPSREYEPEPKTTVPDKRKDGGDGGGDSGEDKGESGKGNDKGEDNGGDDKKDSDDKDDDDKGNGNDDKTDGKGDDTGDDKDKENGNGDKGGGDKEDDTGDDKDKGSGNDDKSDDKGDDTGDDKDKESGNADKGDDKASGNDDGSTERYIPVKGGAKTKGRSTKGRVPKGKGRSAPKGGSITLNKKKQVNSKQVKTKN